MTTPLHEKQFSSDERVKLPRPFVLRRLHSLLGVWLVIYLFEHLLVNSQMALYVEDNGSGFIRMVNSIHSMPYLKVVEILFLALPFLIHGIWGVKYALTGRPNSQKTNGATPSLPQYKRNRAYTWQRITAWLLVVGIIAHVAHMRFIEYPTHLQHGHKVVYMTRLAYDSGLALVAQKLNVELYSSAQIRQKEYQLKEKKARLESLPPQEGGYKPSSVYYNLLSEVQENEKWLAAAKKKPLNAGKVLVAAP